MLRDNCQYCNREYVPSKYRPQKYCSHPCYSKAKIGHTPWNKGKTGVYSAERLKAMSEHAKKNGVRPPSQAGVKQSEETIQKRILRGEKHYNWKGGITSAIQRRVNASSWRKLRIQILERDNYTCQDCSSTEKLSVNHIEPYRISQNNSPSNLITLCLSCHARADAKLRKLVWQVIVKDREVVI